MECERCYRFKHCWACVNWFPCKMTPPESMACFKCDMKECEKNVDGIEFDVIFCK